MHLDMDSDEDADPDARQEVKFFVHPEARKKLRSLKLMNKGATMSGIVNSLLVHLFDLPTEYAGKYGDNVGEEALRDALKSLYEEELREEA